LTAFSAVFFILWLAALGCYAFSAYCLASFLNRNGRRVAAPPGPGFHPPVTVLKPIMGADENTYLNLKSFIDQDYPVCQLVFGMADENDPARAVVERLVREYPEKELAMAITGRSDYPNRKVGNLAGMYPLAKYDILIIADSDMRVGPDYVKEVSSCFLDGSVGLVTCLYRGSDPENVGAAFEALTINTDFTPSVAMALRVEGLSFALGATMAVRRDALLKIGGFEALKDYLADDYMLGNKVKAAGFELRMSQYVVDSVEGRGSLAGYFMHQLRWGRTYRVCRPVGYFFYVLTKGTFFAAAFLVASGFSALGWAVLLTELALRYSQAFFIDSRLRPRGVRRFYWLLPVKDLAAAAIWALSFTGKVVKWKDSQYEVDKEGRMNRV
jgi:ceramide glucosyltransferase